MPETGGAVVRDVLALRVPRVGRVIECTGAVLPFRLLDAGGTEVAAVSEFLHEMLADDASPASLRSYAYDLLAWFRFLWAVEVPWDPCGSGGGPGLRPVVEDREEASTAAPAGRTRGRFDQSGTGKASAVGITRRAPAGMLGR